MALLWALGVLLPQGAQAASAEFRVAADTPDLMWPLYSDPAWDSDVDATEAWDSSLGSDVTVGVLDQRIYAAHVKFGGRIDDEENLVAAQEECAGPVPTLGDDHGTLVAGLIVAQHGGPVPFAARNLSGLAPEARVRPIRAVNDCGVASLKAVTDGIRYAKDAALPIVVISLDTDPLLPVKRQQEIATELDAAFNYAADTLFVVAAGNEGNDNDVPGRQVYPCSTTAPNVICVGMTGEATKNVPAPYTDAPVCWGNVGATSVDLFAPGLRIYSTARGSTGSAYAVQDGTSFAAPLVAAAAALLEATDPLTFGPEQLRTALEAGVDWHMDLAPLSTTGGRLNAVRSLQGSGRFGRSGDSEPWVSCDPDHDGLRGADDQCEYEAGPRTFAGCPDTDEDSRPDRSDNCPSTANPGWADTDGDTIGDACDETPYGPDSDGDGVYDLYDGCPNQFALTPTGCPPVEPPPDPPKNPGPPTVTPTATPTPTPTPALQIYLKVDVTKAKAAKVRIRLSRTAKVTLKIERKSGRKWKRVTPTKSVTATVSAKSLTLRPTGGKKLTRGSYRVRATVGKQIKTQGFKVK